MKLEDEFGPKKGRLKNNLLIKYYVIGHEKFHEGRRDVAGRKS